MSPDPEVGGGGRHNISKGIRVIEQTKSNKEKEEQSFLQVS